MVHIKCGKGQMGSFDASKQIFLHLKNCNWLYLCAWIKILVCRYQKENGFLKKKGGQMSDPLTYYFVNLHAQMCSDLCSQSAVWMEFLNVKADL